MGKTLTSATYICSLKTSSGPAKPRNEDPEMDL